MELETYHIAGIELYIYQNLVEINRLFQHEHRQYRTAHTFDDPQSVTFRDPQKLKGG